MLYYGFIFISGLIMGGILNGCIYRCSTTQKSLDLVSLLRCLVCRGKSCSGGQKLPPRSFLVAMLTGLVSIILFSKYGLTGDFAAFLFLTYLLIAVFFIDLTYRIIPNELVITGLIGGAVLFGCNFFRPFLIFGDHSWWNPLLGLVSGSGFLLAVALVGAIVYKSDEVMGMGDVKILAPIGLFLGWRMTLLALFIAVCLGGVVSLMLILLGKADRKKMIPFGPFIATGVFITMMWGWDILAWYLITYL